jgi:hypothetical protein
MVIYTGIVRRRNTPPPPPRLQLSGEVREGVADTLREVLAAQAPYWRSLWGAALPVPADVAWLPDHEEKVLEKDVEALTISMSRADLKAFENKQSMAGEEGGDKSLAPAAEKPLIPAAGEPLPVPAVVESVVPAAGEPLVPAAEKSLVPAAEKPLVPASGDHLIPAATTEPEPVASGDQI